MFNKCPVFNKNYKACKETKYDPYTEKQDHLGSRRYLREQKKELANFRSIEISRSEERRKWSLRPVGHHQVYQHTHNGSHRREKAEIYEETVAGILQI